MTIQAFELRDSAYAARRALRSGDVDGYLRRNKKWNTAHVRRLAQIIEPLLRTQCVAAAESLAIETLIKELA